VLTRASQGALLSWSTVGARPPWDRITVGKRFFAPVQTRRGDHPGSSKRVPGFFPGVRRPGRGVDRPVVEQYLSRDHF